MIIWMKISTAVWEDCDKEHRLTDWMNGWLLFNLPTNNILFTLLFHSSPTVKDNTLNTVATFISFTGQLFVAEFQLGLKF